jgi:hormone-sensitive lipase
VVLVGDSAGGNLIAALTVLAIKERVRVPDGLLMAYPALNLDRKGYTPSMMVSIDDACNDGLSNCSTTAYVPQTVPYVLRAG